MKNIFSIIILLCSNHFWSQGNEWHVKPYSDNYNNIAGNDGTSFQKAMCLQYALNGGLNGTQIQPGDIIWLHGDDKATYSGVPTANAIYRGHFQSNITGGTVAEDYITVSSYPGEWAVINGNVHDSPPPPNGIPAIGGNSDIFILAVFKGNVRFQNFEITCLGNFSRIKDMRPIVAGSLIKCSPTNPPAYLFHEYVGIQHWAPNAGSAIRNEFRNLVFRNIPGIALASWKYTNDSEIYGNIFYNNGIIEVNNPPGCTPLEQVQLTPNNTMGHQTCVYTQNASDVDRIIRNNIFLNCYDSAVNIWSASDATEKVNNYVVSKNTFINNGSPVLDETANMLVSANGGRINNIDVFSNLYYRNSTCCGNAGLEVKFTTDIVVRNNYFFNGTSCSLFHNTNHNVTFENNFYVGKNMHIHTSIENYKGLTPSAAIDDAWKFNNNQYYTWYNAMFRVPLIGETNYNDMGNSRVIRLYANSGNPSETYFRKSEEYFSELNSSWGRYVNQTRTGDVIPASRYFIMQNQYNPNVFYVSIYNQSESTSPFAIDFNGYAIPSGRTYRIKDSQNYLMATSPIAQGTYTSGAINFPIPIPSTDIFNPTNFELPSPPVSLFGTYGPAYIPTTSPPIHSNKDFNTYVIEFDCNFAYKKHDDFIVSTDNTTKAYLVKHNVTLGPSYTAITGADVTTTAGNEILIKSTAWIGSGAKLWAKIGDPCSDVSFDTTKDEADFDMGSGLNRNMNHSFSAKTDSAEENDFNIFPNPTTGFFTIESTKSEKINRVRITKLDTATIFQEQHYNGVKEINIDISKNERGLYAVQVFFEDNSSQTRTIIKK